MCNATPDVYSWFLRLWLRLLERQFLPSGGCHDDVLHQLLDWLRSLFM